MSGFGKREDGAMMGPMLLLGFGLLAFGYGIYEWVRSVQQPEALVVACSRAAIEGAGEGRWIHTEPCFLDWDAAVEREVGERKQQRVPVLEAEGGARVAMLVVAGERRGELSGTTRVEGVVDDAIDDVPAIDRGGVPVRGLPLYLIPGGVLMLGLAAHYWRKAIRAGVLVEVPAPSVAQTYAASSYEPPRIASLAPAKRGGTFFDRGDDFNFVLLLGAPPLLGLAIVVMHFVDGAKLVPWIVALLVVPFGLMLVWALVQQRGQDRFPERVRAATTFAGSAVDVGERMDGDTQIVVFEHVVSMVAVSITFASRPLVVGVDRLWPTQAIATTITLLFGWWGLPTGPFKTIAALQRNLRGGHRERIADLEGPLDRAHGPRVDV